MTKISHIAMLTMLRYPIAFDDGPALKMAADGKTPEFREGKLVFMAGGKEDLIDPVEIYTSRSRITALNGESAARRKELETAQSTLKAFEGLDAEKAREALGIVEKLDQKKLVDAGKIDEVRAEISKSFEGQLNETRTRAETLQGRINSMILNGAFDRSAYAKDKLTIPSDIVASTFGKHFTVGEDGKITAKGPDGNVIYSRKADKSGQEADFEEALAFLVESYPNKAAILKGGNGSGSGNAGGGGNNAGATTITRAEFQKLLPAEQAAKAALAREGKLKIID